LALRVTEQGHRSWSFLFTSPRDGKRARATLGTYPATSLAEARREALEAKGHVEAGRDPRDVLAAEEAGAMTVKGLIPLYLEKPNKKTGRPRKSIKEIERRLNHNVVPFIGSVKLADLHKRDVNRFIAPIMQRKKPIEATRVFEDFRAMIRWAARQGYLDRNPIDGMEPPARSVEGDRVLDDSEIRTLWLGLPEALARSAQCQTIIKLCLVTAQRVGEVAGINLSEIDLRKRVWNLPATRTKNGLAHTVPLSDLAISIIEAQIAAIEPVANADNGCSTGPLFPCGDGSLSPVVVARAILRAHETSEERPKGRFGIAPWSSHDLRRTAVSKMGELGIAPIVVGHVINHSSVTRAGVTLKVYNHYDYAKEKRQAFELWANHLDAICQGAAAKVTPLRRGQRR
jgi:integrase